MSNYIPNWLLQRAYVTPDRTALVFGKQSWSFAEMKEIVLQLAASLAAIPIQEGSKAAILMKNRPETVWVIHALQQLGIETVFLNHRLTASELTFQLEDSGAKTLIFDRDFSSEIESLTKLSAVKPIAANEIGQLSKKNLPKRKEFFLNDVCSIMYTSGTTGKPKGVLQTYGNHWWSAIGSSLNLGLHENDAWLCAVPVFHISGLSILMRSVIYGIPVYLMEQFDAQEANQLLKSGNITIMSVVSVMVNRMLGKLADQRYHSNFRCMLLGGGPAPRPLLELCKEKSIPVFQTYGMTETASQIVTLSPEDSLKKLGSAGKPLFPSQIKIIATDGREAKPHETGEITVKGPNVTHGYLKRDNDNLKSFHDGWFFTGDLGYIDENGYLFVLDRRSDLIISGGENIYPAEIEGVLMGHEAVIEAGVAGIEDPVWGQVPYAFIVANKKVDEDELKSFCRNQLAAYKVPKRIYQIDVLPRNGANKLMRRHLLQYIPEER